MRGTTGSCNGWHYCTVPRTEDELSRARKSIFRCVQQAAYASEIKAINKGEDLPRVSTLRKLNPGMDKDDLLRIGGRLGNAKLDENERNPLIIPSQSHIAILLVRHYHEKVKHQGRHFTEGAIRSAGLWIVGAKRCIASTIHKCIRCRKLRGKQEEQKMADLPADRLSVEPPFTSVGIDVFGPWTVISRRTRGGLANSKRWAVLFTCMSTRAVHIEVIESMDSSSFLNALRRFFAIRGPAKQLCSDCGTNFIGACKELKINTENVEDYSVRKYLSDQGCTWIFNPPHSSHMGGAWECMIGIARRILDSMLCDVGSTRLSHEVLTTLMAEVSAIINSRPLIPVSTDPESPFILTPATLLTQKTDVLTAPTEEASTADLYRRQWRQVQSFANTFWRRWKNEYLTTLQVRNKWQSNRPDIQEGDLVLLKDNQAKRNEWPMGRILKSIPSADGKVRKVEVMIAKQGVARTFIRPIVEIVLLLSRKDMDK
ncbi:uncharacterized protein LOC133356498 [Lethenteron reissneri]|uniref:uncharacterized protein LOC133356498 n=1 Tax=Lethenteron reissneri TaxID=7753 RepID=UPI002AB63BA8|nr:uncharacterized protein LOC133356498 [Lethenteron reissneri]